MHFAEIPVLQFKNKRQNPSSIFTIPALCNGLCCWPHFHDMLFHSVLPIHMLDVARWSSCDWWRIRRIFLLADARNFLVVSLFSLGFFFLHSLYVILFDSRLYFCVHCATHNMHIFTVVNMHRVYRRTYFIGTEKLLYNWNTSVIFIIIYIFRFLYGWHTTKIILVEWPSTRISNCRYWLFLWSHRQLLFYLSCWMEAHDDTANSEIYREKRSNKYLCW